MESILQNRINESLTMMKGGVGHRQNNCHMSINAQNSYYFVLCCVGYESSKVESHDLKIQI